MLSASDETRFFDSCKPELLERYAGQFAVVCGRRLVGVHSSLAQALAAAADAFGDGALEDGAPILISEIAEHARLRVIAEPRPTPISPARSSRVL
jgi:hypothetical protein